jgi:hypothetical protein
VFGKMSKLRIGSIMKFDSTKSRKEAYNCGRKQGALEELENLLEYSDWLQVSRDSTVTYYIIKRLKELKEGV